MSVTRCTQRSKSHQMSLSINTSLSAASLYFFVLEFINLLSIARLYVLPNLSIKENNYKHIFLYRIVLNEARLFI